MAKAVAVAQLVAAGDTVTEACKKHAITVAGYRAALRREPILQEMNDEALSVRNEIYNDMLVNIDLYHSDSKMAAVVSKNIQWVLERNEPEKFGQRLVVDPNNEASKLLAEALNKAIDRIPGAAAPARELITDVTFVDVPKKTPPVNLGGTGGESLGGGAPQPVDQSSLAQLRALGLI
jgi:hypothetical protein